MAEVQSSKDSTQNAGKKHKAVIRLSKSLDEKYENMSKFIDPQVLSNDFAHARSIDELRPEEQALTPFHREIAKNIKHPQQHDLNRADLNHICGQPITNTGKSLSRVCAKYLENKDGETVQMKSNRYDDLCGKPAYIGHHKFNFVESTLATNDTDVFETHCPLLGSLNDILEEDEDIISVTVDQSVSKSQVTLVNEFYIRTQYDQKPCTVTGICALPDGKVLLADDANENVKLFDNEGVYQTHLKLESEPWDVTATEKYEAAVSCPTEKCIHILLIDEDISITRTIDLDKRCYGIIYHGEEIYIAMENEVRIITYKGKVVRKIAAESIRKKRFSWPLSCPKAMFRSAMYVSVNTDEQDGVILVSDSTKICVTAMDRSGQMLSRLRLAIHGAPSGVCAGSGGKFFVCQAPNKLIAIKADEHGHRIKTVLELDAIQAVHYEKHSKLLWVSRRACNFVMVYKYKYA